METAEGQAAPKSPRVTMEHADMSAGFLDFVLFSSPSSPPPVPAGSGVFDVGPDGNGAFTFKNVYPGEYVITPGFALPSHYLDSIRLGARDALAPNVQILSGAEPITITYKRDGGTVRGSVEDCGPGTVVLIPRELARRLDGFIRQTTCGQNGHFEIPAVRPGEYYGFAVAKGGPNVRSLELDQTVINQSVRVSVRANEATDAEIRLIAR